MQGRRIQTAICFEDIDLAKALAVRQPWATLIIDKSRTMEIRSWRTRYRGKLFICASQKIDKRAAEILKDVFPGLIETAMGERDVILGSAELVDVVPLTEEFFRKHFHDHQEFEPWKPGLFAWLLENPRRLKQPVPLNGKCRLGIFDLNDDLLKK